MRTIAEDLDYTAHFIEKRAFVGPFLKGLMYAGGTALSALMLKQYGEEGWHSWSRGSKGRKAIRQDRAGRGPAARTGAVYIDTSPSQMQPDYMKGYN